MKNFSRYALAFAILSVGSAKAALTPEQAAAKAAFEKSCGIFIVDPKDSTKDILEPNATTLATAQKLAADRAAAYEAGKVEEATKDVTGKLKYYGYGKGLSWSTRILVVGTVAALVGGFFVKDRLANAVAAFSEEPAEEQVA